MNLQKKKNRLLFISFAVSILCILATVIAIWKCNTYSLELSISDETITLEYGVDEMPEITAQCKGTLINKKGTLVKPKMNGSVDLQTLGTYHVTYTTTYKNVTLSESRTIIVTDTLPPVIELISDPEHFTSPNASYEEEGFTATDNYDGDLTAQVVRQEQDGVVTYTVTDTAGNTTSTKRTIVYKDVIPPTITLTNGEKCIYIKVGTDYSDPGFSASDNVDGDLTSKVQVSGSVDTSKMGINTLTYTVNDSSGNTTSVTRSVYVYQKQAVSNPTNPGDKVVYLTFDDGPGKYTARLLDILDKYGVKATFFVTNQFPTYQNMIGETYRRGHTIALHTYSHNYNIYQSEDTYYHDLLLMNNICVQQTGVTPTIVRFPGGTSNTISRNYCNGIMTSLSHSLSYHGYLYCDWNVSSGDAGNNSTYDSVVNNVISGIKKHSVSVVLQHDIKSHSVEAVDQIIFWGLQNGYTFLPMTESTPMVHHTPRN